MNTKAQLKKNFNMKMENIKDKEDVLYYYMLKFQRIKKNYSLNRASENPKCNKTNTWS